MIGSHSDGFVHVPQKNILRPGTRIDPYNPAVFWSVMARLIGENSMRKFWSMPPAELVTLANALKKDKTWNDFILDYIAVVSEFSTELCEHEKKVFEKLEKDRYPHPYYNFNRFIAAINFVFLTNTIFFSSAFREAVAAKYLSYTFSAWGFYWLIKDSVNGYLNSRRRMLSVNLLNLMNKS
ncbi:MAG: hypothetical protein HGA80_09355 [Candidatus Omnitrophica bacterium]|nr:hypothetical protein [Candidatus Omnitrophota bacterium]